MCHQDGINSRLLLVCSAQQFQFLSQPASALTSMLRDKPDPFPGSSSTLRDPRLHMRTWSSRFVRLVGCEPFFHPRRIDRAVTPSLELRPAITWWRLHSPGILPSTILKRRRRRWRKLFTLRQVNTLRGSTLQFLQSRDFLCASLSLRASLRRVENPLG